MPRTLERKLLLSYEVLSRLDVHRKTSELVWPLLLDLVIVMLREVLIAFAVLLAFMFMGDGILRVMNLISLWLTSHRTRAVN